MNAKITSENVSSASSRPLKILYIQPGTSTFAGIERVVDTICTCLADKYSDTFDIDVLYTSVHQNRPKEVPRYTAIDRLASSRLGLIWILRDVIASKDYSLVVVPQIEPTVVCMVACIGIRRKFAVYLHGNPRLERSHIKAKLLFFLMRAFFVSRVASVFGTSPRQLAAFKTMFKSNQPDFWVPNPVRKFDVPDEIAARQIEEIRFINVGRFSFQKGQDILLAAFSELRKVRSNIKLKIVGYGQDETALREKIERLGLEDAVSIEYHPDNPQPALAESDVYVSTSRWEGWSLAICEALRFGLPVIATDCEFGPSDILIDPRLGRLVPIDDLDELVETMDYYCRNLNQEKTHGRFRQSFIDRFSTENVVDIHADALMSTATS